MMGWNKKEKRWVKMVNYKPLKVSPRQLKKAGLLAWSASETEKEASREAANKWLEQRLAMMSPSVPPLLSQKIAWAREHGRDDLAETLSKQPFLRSLVDATDPAKNIGKENCLAMAQRLVKAIEDFDFETDPKFAELVEGIDDPNERAQFGKRLWKDRLAHSKAKLVAPSRSLRARLEIYLQSARNSHQSGEMARATLGDYLDYTTRFVDWLGGENDCSIINEDKWLAWAEHVKTLPSSHAVKTKMILFSRRFVRHLDSMKVIERPRNLTDRVLRRTEKPKIKSLSVEQVREILSKVKGRLRLVVLLGLNGGLTQEALSEIEPSQLKSGVLTWSRGKMESKGGRTVHTPLWTETLELIRKYGLPFLTERGRRWKSQGANGKNDLAYVAWTSFRTCLSFSCSLKDLRSTSATQLGHSDFRDCVDVWLGHGGKSMATKHYIDPDTAEGLARMKQAVSWLHARYFGE